MGGKLDSAELQSPKGTVVREPTLRCPAPWFFGRPGCPYPCFRLPSDEGLERREAPGSWRGFLHRPCDRPVSTRQDSGTQVLRGVGVPGRAGPLRKGPAPPGAPTRRLYVAAAPCSAFDAAIDDALD